ncbi:MAG TPA: hypothetical protein VMN60_03425 [Longimicrobiales bacterium]|nr:hypothetical protein [Longimicrobiales bacterium]
MIAFVLPALLLPGCQPAAEEPVSGTPAADEVAAAPTPATTPEGKVEEATAGAPASISAGARVLDWPAGDGQDFSELRAGNNGWTCLPDHPGMNGFQPMCLDGVWMEWLQAFAGGTAPELDAVGFAYMVTAEEEGSNTDPTATAPTPDNQWHKWGPHVMVVFPNAAALRGIPTDPQTVGPYVMWGGTPYAHVMIPVGAHEM